MILLNRLVLLRMRPQREQECALLGVNALLPVANHGLPQALQLMATTRSAMCGSAFCAIRVRTIDASRRIPSMMTSE